MKKLLLLLATPTLLLVSMVSFAQQKEGKVLYERISQIQVNVAGMPGMEQNLPRTRTDKFELSFGNNLSLWKQAEQENEDNDLSSGGMQIRMIGIGSDDVLFTDLDKKTRVEKRDFMDKQFIVDDSIRPLKWKLSEDTKTILNHLCRKATATNISKRTMMTNDNGKMERKEVDDTANITAWFASDIPVSAGPAEYQGQLPGLILEMDVNNGRQSFRALSIDTKLDLATIKAPTGKKHYTREEYTKERDKMLEEMQRNNGGQRVMRMN
jgi:GLPGLI family protein